MWVMTTRGFYSAVQDRDNPARLLIRARCEDDIRNLKDLLPNSEPWRLKRSDYEWRLSCTVAEWAGVLANMALDIDYGNFKNAVRREQGAARASVYTSVWSVLLRLEPRGRFAWPKAKKSKGKGRRARKVQHETLPYGFQVEFCPFCQEEAVETADPDCGGTCDNCGEYVTREDLEIANG